MKDRKSCINFRSASSYSHQLGPTINLNIKLRLYTANVLWMWSPRQVTRTTWKRQWEENGHDNTQARCLPSPLPTYNLQHLMARRCDKWRCDEEGRHGSTPIHIHYKRENGWPHPPTAERKISPYSYVLGARRRQKKEREAEEDTAKHLQRRPGRDGCQSEWNPPDRQWP